MDPARIDPIAKRILAMMPLPTLEGTSAGGFSNNWSRRQTTDTRRNNFDAKVNLNRTNAHQMWFKLSYMYADVPDLWTFPAPEVGGTVTRIYQPTFGQTWVLSPTLTLTARWGCRSWTRKPSDFPLGMVGPGRSGFRHERQNRTTSRVRFYTGFEYQTGFQTFGPQQSWPADPERRRCRWNNLTKFVRQNPGRLHMFAAR
jgi:hypothetical protein